MLVTLLTAIVAGPVLMLLVLQSDRAPGRQGARARCCPWPACERAPALIAFLERAAGDAARPRRRTTRTMIRSGDLDVVLEVDAAFADDVAQGTAGHGARSPTIARAIGRARRSTEAEALLRAFNREWGRSRGCCCAASRPTSPIRSTSSRVDLATPQQSGALVLFLIAFYGLFASVMGGMAVALDTTAGERERPSLEPLLMTPARRCELATGKWLRGLVLNAAGRGPDAVGVLPDAALRAAAGGRHSVPVRAGRTRPLRRRADPADPADAGDPALRRLPRPHVQGGAVQSVRCCCSPCRCCRSCRCSCRRRSRHG